MKLSELPNDDPAGELRCLDASSIARVFALWDRLAGFDPARWEEALLEFLAELKRLAVADDAVWLGLVRMRHGREAERDHQLGWRTRAVVHLEWTELKRSVVAEAMKAQEKDGGVPSSIEMAKLAGRFRTLTLRELHDMGTFTRTHHYPACFVPFQITDRLWCVLPVGEDCEVAVIFDRCGDHPRFSKRDRAVVSVAMRGLKWFHRQMVLANGVTLGKTRLSPREKGLLNHLLSDKTEKEIAENLHLSLATVRGYTKSLYQKLGVRGRVGLISLWLGRG